MSAPSISPDAPEQWEHVRYEIPAQGVARIVLARADARNAQDKRMPFELNAAFDGVQSVREQAKWS